DDANANKNWERHHVTPEEAEDVFFHEPLIVRSDVRHSKQQKPYYALGQTASNRWLFVAFTIQRKLVRLISVREMNRNEARLYRRHEKEYLSSKVRTRSGISGRPPIRLIIWIGRRQSPRNSFISNRLFVPSRCVCRYL